MLDTYWYPLYPWLSERWAVDARILVTVLRTVFALLSLYAIGRQLGIHAQLGLSLTNFYPFLNPANVGGYGGVAVYAVGVTATFMIGGWVLIAFGNRRRGASTFG
jgi:hypothetical protein